MKNWKAKIGLIGVCCSSLCFLGLPVLMALMPIEWMGSTVFQWAVRAMVFISLYFSISAARGGFKRHRNIGPLVILLPASIVLVFLSFYVVPKPLGWLAFGAFVVSWFWNHALLKKLDKISCH